MQVLGKEVATSTALLADSDRYISSLMSISRTYCLIAQRGLTEKTVLASCISGMWPDPSLPAMELDARAMIAASA